MKSNFFKYVFIIFVVIIVIFAIYMIYFNNQKKQNNVEENIVEEVTQIKDIRLGISNFDTINPIATKNKEVLNVSKLIFEPLMEIDENYRIKNCLATECSKISNTSYIIKIDNNVKWHNGNPLLAKDIQYTIEKLKEGNSIYSSNVEKVENVEVLDTNTVRINLTEEEPFFEYNLIFPILPSMYYVGEDIYTSTKTPIGTGMYKIESINSSEIKLVKNEKWWNIKNKNAKVETIQIKIYSEVGEVYNSFKLGKVDIITTANTNLEEYIGTIGYSKTEIKGRQFDYLAFNCQNNILQDKNVRKAITYAIDKNNIVSSIYNNQCYTSEFPLDYGSYLYESEKKIEYNQEQFKNILQENGWEYKNKYWQKTENYKTKRLKFTIIVNRNDEKRVSVAENIKKQLEEVGIRITIQKVSEATYKQILENKNYEIIITGVYNSYSPNLETFFGDNNLQNYNNEELSKLLTEVKNTNEEKIVAEKYKKIINIYNEEQPFISLYRNKITIVKSQNLTGKITGNNYFSYYGIEEWYRK